MSHERVIKVAGWMLPVVGRLPEAKYQGVGLCSPETRAQRLGCSHTMARIKLESAIDELETGEKSVPGSFLRSELNWLNNEIHLLDHRKGEAEKTLALLEAYNASDRAGQVERLREAEAKVREMERLHDEYVDRIGILRDTVVTEMDKLIERVARGSSPTGREGVISVAERRMTLARPFKAGKGKCEMFRRRVATVDIQSSLTRRNIFWGSVTVA